MVNKIIDAICIALSNEFGAEYKIYTDNVEQGFSNPCFYVSSINSSRNHFISKKYKSKNSFEVLYFPSDTDDKSFEMFSIEERLYECLEYLDESGDLIRGKGMGSRVVDNVLNFTIDYDLFLVKKQVDDNDMEGLDQSMFMKG